MPEPYSKDCLDIRTLKHLSLRLGFPLEELQEVAKKAESLYRFDKQPKGNGGFREISEPYPRLKRIQKSIHRLLGEIRVSDCAHGSIKKKSHLTNARVHCCKEWLFTLDFKSYFPNISNLRVYNLFCHELKCFPEVASLLTRLCTVRYQVPQGGSTSTDIANLVCRKIDIRLKGLATKFKIDYTRLIDDITFSGNNIPESFQNTAKQIIKQNGFKLNPFKESLRGKHQSQIVTGLSVNRKRPHVPKEKRRQIRKEKYIFEKFESATLPEIIQRKRQQQINGKTAYINYINQAN